MAKKFKKGQWVKYPGGIGKITYVPYGSKYVVVKAACSKYEMSWKTTQVREPTKKDIAYIPKDKRRCLPKFLKEKVN